MQYLYHITNQKSAAKIRKSKTITPENGNNSQLAGENEPYIYLCEYKDIPYWKQLLGRHTCIRIPICDIPDNTNLKKHTYSNYSEYLISKPIHSENFKLMYFNAPTAKTNKELCWHYIYTINQMCMNFVRYYDKQYPATLSILIEDITAQLKILKRLNFQQLTKEDYKEITEELIDSCAYTFADIYNNTSKRIWEQLIKYPTDESIECRQQLHTFIKQNLTPILYIHTGGWINTNTPE